MKNLSLDLALPKEIHVVRVPVPQVDTAKAPDVPMTSVSGRMFQFLGQWVDVAQAKTDN